MTEEENFKLAYWLVQLVRHSVAPPHVFEALIAARFLEKREEWGYIPSQLGREEMAKLLREALVSQ